jgi:hypothetical protein
MFAFETFVRFGTVLFLTAGAEPHRFYVTHTRFIMRVSDNSLPLSCWLRVRRM